MKRGKSEWEEVVDLGMAKRKKHLLASLREYTHPELNLKGSYDYKK